MADKKNLANGELSEEELDQAVGGVNSAQMKGRAFTTSQKSTIVSATESIDAQLKAGAQIASAAEIAASAEIEGNNAEVSASALQQIKNATAVKPTKRSI